MKKTPIPKVDCCFSLTFFFLSFLGNWLLNEHYIFSMALKATLKLLEILVLYYTLIPSKTRTGMGGIQRKRQ